MTRIHPVRVRLGETGPHLVSARIPGEAAAVFVRLSAGAADEHDPEHGLAHFLEHMLFKGTTTRGLGESARAIECLGGDLNAWTSHDELVVHATVAGNAWRETLDVIVDMIRRPIVDPDEVVRERLVVQEEIASYDDEPDESLSDAVQAGLWGAHPYGRVVIGTHDGVGAFTHGDVRRFHDREFGSDRATFIVVADAEPEEVAHAVTLAIEGWLPVGARRTPPRSSALDRLDLVRPKGTFDDRIVEIAWPLPPPDHADHAPLAVLASILGSTCGDRITERLDEEPKAGFDGWADAWTGLFGSSFNLGLRPLPGHTEDALRRVRALLDEFRASCRGRLVVRARETMLADLQFAEQTVDGIGELLLLQESIHGDATTLDRWRQALAAVQPDDVSRAARTWLDPERAVLGVLDADLTDERVRAAWGATKVRHSARRDRVETTIGGTPVIIQQVNVPVAAVRIVARGGALSLTDQQAGLGAAWAGTVHRGAGPYDGEALHDALDDLACELTPTDGLESWSLTATAPSSNVLDLAELLGEVALDAHLSEDEWGLVREELLEGVRTRFDRPRQVVAERAAALRFPGHPWRLPGGGTEASLARLHARSLSKAHDAHFSQGRGVVVVCGGVDPDEALASLEWLADMPKAPKAVAPPAWPKLVPGVHEVAAGTHQAIVSLLGDGVPLTAVDRRGLELAEAVLEGQSGRLFLELRERMGLAYELWAASEERSGGGLFQVGLACDPTRTAEASEALRACVASLLTHPPDDAELSRARAMLIGRETLRQQRVESSAARLAFTALYGLDLSLAAYRRRLEATGVTEVIDEVTRLLAAGWIEVRSVPREPR